jgi:hypothetical protein
MRRQHRSGAPPARGGVNPRIDLTGIGLEVELQYPSQLRPPTDPDQGLRPVRVIRRELHRELRAERHPHQHSRPRAATVQYRRCVRGQPRQPGHLPEPGRPVGQSDAPTVEQHNARADSQPADQMFQRRLLPDHLEVADQRRHQHEQLAFCI